MFHVVFVVIPSACAMKQWRHTSLVLPVVVALLDSREETRGELSATTSWAALQISSKESSHRQDSTYHGFYYTSCGALAGTEHCSIYVP